MITLKLKVLLQKQVGCDIWLTMFEATDETGVDAPVLPQHFVIYTEGKPDLSEGNTTSLQLWEQSDLHVKRP